LLRCSKLYLDTQLLSTGMQKVNKPTSISFWSCRSFEIGFLSSFINKYSYWKKESNKALVLQYRSPVNKFEIWKQTTKS